MFEYTFNIAIDGQEFGVMEGDMSAHGEGLGNWVFVGASQSKKCLLIELKVKEGSGVLDGINCVVNCGMR